jgi:fibronectin-binding autotransporter adhesin
VGSAADVTSGYRLGVEGLRFSNVSSAATNTVAVDLELLSSDTVFDLAATPGMLTVAGLTTNAPSAPARLVVRGPGTAYFYYRTTAATTAAHTGGTRVTDGGELRIYGRGTLNPATFWFGASPSTITLANGTLSLNAAGGSNAGINNDIVVDGAGTLRSSHSHVESGTARSCNISGALYLNGALELAGPAETVAVNNGTNTTTMVAYNKPIYIGQADVGTRRITQNVSLAAPNRKWSIQGRVRDGAGGAGNALELRNTSPNRWPLVFLYSTSSDYASGTRILDDGVAEDLSTFANAIESTAATSADTARFGIGPVVVEGGGLLVLRYNRRSTANAFVPIGIHTTASLTADGTVFFGGRGARYGTTNDFMTAAFDGLSGTGRVVVSHMRLRIGNNNGGTTFDGTLLDDPYAYPNATNQLVKAGTGTWTLAGTASHGGGMIVSNGTLRINGRLEHGDIQIASGGMVDGSGTLAMRVGNTGAERVVCAGTFNAAGLTIETAVDPGTTESSFVLVDCSEGSLQGTGTLTVQTPPQWIVRTEATRILLVKPQGLVVLLR